MQRSQKLRFIFLHIQKEKRNTYISNMRTCHQTQTVSILKLKISQLNSNQHIGLKKKKKKEGTQEALPHSPSAVELKPVSSSSTRTCSVGDVERRIRSTEGSKQKNEIRQVLGTFDDEAKTAE